MRVILQERVANLGNVGDCVRVARGFARNYLLPRGKAVQENEANLGIFETRRASLEQRAADVLSEAQKRAQEFDNCVITLTAQASEEGKLFGSVGPRDIAKAAQAMGKVLEKSEIEMPEGPIRLLGEYTVTLQLHSEVHSKVTIIVNPV